MTREELARMLAQHDAEHTYPLDRKRTPQAKAATQTRKQQRAAKRAQRSAP